MIQSGRQEFEENRSSTAISTCQTGSNILVQGQSPMDDAGILSASTMCPTPLIRQFWKAGNYDDTFGFKITVQTIAELLDNAVDEWSPYSTEEELLKQFDDIGSHGTKIIIYNLWFSDDRIMELDFDMDPEDIRIGGDIKKVGTIRAWRTVNEQHIANRLHYSLRVYLSILYLRRPETFRIILRTWTICRAS